MLDWKNVIADNKNMLEAALLLQSYGYHAGNNYGFIIKAERFQAETTAELLNNILGIAERRLKPYKNPSKSYSNVSVLISISGTGIYLEYK